MKNFTIATAAAAGLTAAFLGLAAPALAAPTGGNAEDTISALEAQGNRVVVNHQGNTPLSEASVVSVTHGPITREVVPNSTSQGDNARTFVHQTIYVTVR